MSHSVAGRRQGQCPRVGLEKATSDRSANACPPNPLVAPGPVFGELQTVARGLMRSEPAVASYLTKLVIEAHGFESALINRLTIAFSGDLFRAAELRDLISPILSGHAVFVEAAIADLLAIVRSDPASEDLLTPFAFFKGFAALSFQRVAHHLWVTGHRAVALMMQQCLSLTMNIDLHPGAEFGQGIMLDHANGVVVGETASVGDDVILLHNVTLGGTGKERGNRHPKVEAGVFLGAGAQLLGVWSRCMMVRR